MPKARKKLWGYGSGAAIFLVILLFAAFAILLADRGAWRGGGYAGNLHMHTLYSDGQDSYDEMIDEAVKLNLSFVAVTDHWMTAEGLQKCTSERRLLCIPSEEFSTPNGHILAINITKHIPTMECETHQDDKWCDGGMSIKTAVDRIHEWGGIAIAAHPVSGRFPITEDDLKLFDAMECDHPGYTAAQAAESEQLARRLGLPCVYNSDAHDRSTLRMMYDVCELETLDATSVMKAITENKCRRHAYFGLQLSRTFYLPTPDIASFDLNTRNTQSV